MEKTSRRLFSFLAIALFYLVFGISDALGALSISSSTLDGASSATVAPSASVTAAVSVTVSNKKWKSTGWRIGTSGSYTCVDHANHTSSSSESFNITAPATSGAYTVNFVAYTNNSCSKGATSVSSNTLTVSSGGGGGTSVNVNERNFLIRNPSTAQTLRGDVRVIGNTVLCVHNASGQCYDYTGSSANSNLDLQYIDVDGVSRTYNNSSQAQLAIPSTAVIKWAGIYTQGYLNITDQTTLGNTLREAVYVTVPTVGTITSVPTVIDVLANGSDGYTYDTYAPLTELIGKTGAQVNGWITGANIKANTGTENSGLGNYGAWTLVVIYNQPTETLKNISVYDGYKKVANATGYKPVNIPVSGFTTPLSGNVHSSLSLFAGGGDKNIAKDALSLNDTAINNTNAFYSTLMGFTPNPDFSNTQGSDIQTHQVGVDGNTSHKQIIGTGQNSATITLTTKKDAYFLSLAVFATKIYAPEIGNFEKNATITYASNRTCSVGKDLRGAALHYEVVFENTGSEIAENVHVYDDFDANGILDYLDMTQTTTPTAQLLSGTSTTVTCDKNATAVSCNFGQIGIGTKYKISFDTKVLDTLLLTDDANLSNTANAHYYNASTHQEITQLASSNMQIAGGICAVLPIAEYRMDECSWNGLAGEVKDSIGTNHGTSKTNTASAPEVATTVDTGQINRAGEFKGEGYNADPNNAWYEADYYIEIPDSNTLSPLSTTKAMTISGWFKPDNTNSQTIIHKGNGSVQEYRVFIESNQLKFSVWNQYNSPSTVTIDTTNLASGLTYFFAATAEIDSTNNDLILNLYLKNGSNSDSKSGTFNSFVYPSTPGSLYIGAVQWESLSGYFDGLIDEIKIFSSALSSDSITKIFNNDSNNKNYDGTVRSPVSCDLYPIVDYHFDECSWDGTIGEVEDNSTNSLNGTIQGTAQTTNGLLNNAGFFNNSVGNSDAIVIPDSDLLSPHTGTNGEITISAWVKLNSYPTTAPQWRIPIVAKGDDNNWEYALYIYQDHKAGFSVWQNSGSSYKEISGGNLELNTWYHITGVLKKGNYSRVYVNGSLVAESTREFLGSTTNGTSPLYIARRGSKNNYLDGYIDEVKVFNKALSKPQIIAIYRNESSGNNYDGTPRELPCCCVPTGGNLIANPSFETLCGGSIIKTWNTAGGIVNMRNNVCGWTMNGSGMETWENTTSPAANDGTVFVEIDGNSATVDQLSQTIKTLNDIHYIISLDYRARKGRSDRIIAKWNGTEIDTFTGITSQWQTAQIEVVGTGSDILAFEEPSTDNDSYGSWIDNVRLIEGTLSSNNYGFDAWDDFRSINDRNISTKIVGKDFNLTIASLNEEKTGFQDFNGTACITLVNNSNQPISGWNKLLFNDQNSSNTTFTLNQAIGGNESAGVQIVWKKNIDTTCPIIGESNSTIASDRFAVRPDHFSITTLADPVAGKDFNITFIAPNFYGTNSSDYNETAGETFDVSIAEHNASCLTGVFTPLPTTFSFENGSKTLLTRYSEVGMLDINITETTKPCGSRFAQIDCDDANVSDGIKFTSDLLPITSDNITIIIKPDHFDLNATLQNANGNFTYLSNDLNLSASLNLQISAKNYQNEVTHNYSDECYAQPTSYTVKYSPLAISPSGNLKKLIYHYLDTNTTDVNESEFTFDANKTIFSSGDATLSLNINFDRNETKPLNPFTFELNSIGVTDSNSVIGENTFDQNATFVYGRVRAYDITTNEPSAPNPIEIEVYGKNSSHNFLNNKPQNVLYWYRNTEHSGDAVLNANPYEKTTKTASELIPTLTITTPNPPANGLHTIIVNNSDTANPIQGTIHLEVPLWLWYSSLRSYNDSEGSTCTEHPCFRYDYTDATARVQGVNSGTFQGSDFQMTPAKNITNKGVKLFR